MNRWLSTLLAAGLLLLAAGCSDSDERNHPLYKKGENALGAGNGQEAVLYFGKLLNRRPDAYLVHLRLASAYDELLNDPLRAVMHYKLYLEAEPDAPDAPEVKAWLTQCEKRCYETLHARYAKPETNIAAAENAPAAVTDSTSGSVLDKNDASAGAAASPAVEVAESDEVHSLRKKLAQYQARHKLMSLELERMRKEFREKSPPAAEIAVGAAGENTAEVVPRSSEPATVVNTGVAVPEKTYKVVAGDTPGKIARKVYGKSSLYGVILRANPQVNERKLRAGMVLIIPENPIRQ